MSLRFISPNQLSPVISIENDQSNSNWNLLRFAIISRLIAPQKLITLTEFSFANAVIKRALCSRAYLFSIISIFFPSRNRKYPSFSFLGNSIIHLHQNVSSSKLWKNEKTRRHFVANCPAEIWCSQNKYLPEGKCASFKNTKFPRGNYYRTNSFDEDINTILSLLFTTTFSPGASSKIILNNLTDKYYASGSFSPTGTVRYRGILVYNICLISIRNSVSDGATNKSVLNIESS